MNWTDTRKKSYWKLWTAVAIFALLSALGVLTFRSYRASQAKRLATQALTDFRGGDFERSTLAIQRALEIAPDDPEVVRAVVGLTREAGTRDEIHWRWRLIELSPEQPDELVELAAAAIRHGDVARASEVIESARSQGLDSPGFHSVAGAVAIAKGDLVTAEKEFSVALQQDPENPVHALDLALLQFQSSDPEIVRRASATLHELAATGRTQDAAIRALLAAARHKGDLESGIRLGRGLIDRPDPAFSDQLLLLDMLKEHKDSSFPDYLAALRSQVREDPLKAAVLLEWTGARGMQEDTLAWYRQLPASVRNTATVAAATAACLAELRQWSELVEFAGRHSWGTLEYLRQAYLALGSKSIGDATAFRSHWSSALSNADTSAPRLLRLLRLASIEGWDEEYRQVLWAQARLSDAPNAALHLLYQYYGKEKNAEGMLEVLKRMVEVDPGSTVAKNNFIFLSLLLDRRSPVLVEQARALVEQAPSNFDFISTYALALHYSGATADGLALMESLPQEARMEPERALFYALYLSTAGRRDEADRYLSIAVTGDLLPEEENLLDRIRRSLDAADSQK